ncbi:hypothetical protein CJ030_MR4G024754 [Morella rubra]|uniref:Uncharacterized protein n=1 Tax=Morella rubra TaxID=262757 RepID=A0A6A1WSB3_9ROSI|nr:hypothetical protein CJ030_MR4G024754 [Morella rubra]
MAEVRSSSFNGRLSLELEKAVELAVEGNSGFGSEGACSSDSVPASDIESMSSDSTYGAQNYCGADRRTRVAWTSCDNGPGEANTML